MLHQTCVFASGGIYRSSSALRCVRGVKRRCTIFHARVVPVRIPQKAHGIHYAKLVFLHLVVSVGNRVHCGAFGVQNVTTLFFMLGSDQYGFHKKCDGTC
jgi:hypothetical protein